MRQSPQRPHGPSYGALHRQSAPTRCAGRKRLHGPSTALEAPHTTRAVAIAVQPQPALAQRLRTGPLPHLPTGVVPKTVTAGLRGVDAVTLIPPTRVLYATCDTVALRHSLTVLVTIVSVALDGPLSRADALARVSLGRAQHRAPPRSPPATPGHHAPLPPTPARCLPARAPRIQTAPIALTGRVSDMRPLKIHGFRTLSDDRPSARSLPRKRAIPCPPPARTTSTRGVEDSASTAHDLEHVCEARSDRARAFVYAGFRGT